VSTSVLVRVPYIDIELAVQRPPRLTYPTGIVLVAIVNNYRYGFEIIDATGLGAGTVYPILRRLEEAGLVRSAWEAARTAVDRPPRRYYRVNAGGAAMARDALQRYPGIAGLVGRGAPAPA
jgi:DNA-binding PadR family transcriptional regulator